MAFHFLSLAPITTSELLPPAWSLRFEVAFYLAFSLCLLPYIGRPLLVLWTIIGFWINDSSDKLHHLLPGAPHWMLVLRHTWWILDFVSHPTSYFVSGVLAGLIFAKISPAKLYCLIAVILSGVAFTATLKITRWGSIYGAPDIEFMMAAVIAALILSSALAEKSGLFQFKNISYVLGSMSYSIYILHWTLFLIYDQYFGSIRFSAWGSYVLYVTGLFVIYAVSLFVTFAFDIPIQKFLRRIYH